MIIIFENSIIIFYQQLINLKLSSDHKIVYISFYVFNFTTTDTIYHLIFNLSDFLIKFDKFSIFSLVIKN